MAKFGYIGRTRVRHRGCKYWYYSFCHSAAVVSILETTTLEEHRKVYRQIQDRPKINAGDIVQHRRNIRTVQHPGKDADVVEIQFQEILG